MMADTPTESTWQVPGPCTCDQHSQASCAAGLQTSWEPMSRMLAWESLDVTGASSDAECLSSCSSSPASAPSAWPSSESSKPQSRSMAARSETCSPRTGTELSFGSTSRTAPLLMMRLISWLMYMSALTASNWSSMSLLFLLASCFACWRCAASSSALLASSSLCLRRSWASSKADARRRSLLQTKDSNHAQKSTKSTPLPPWSTCRTAE
mmetsp:Transcript_78792/g.190839  ORF Transcript_78792/g.190839 Transcript_78792/m.190839 type:complete len:210 (-) Transcript_78792:181-810(-)